MTHRQRAGRRPAGQRPAGRRRASGVRFLRRNGCSVALLAAGVLLIATGSALLAAGDAGSGISVFGLAACAAALIPIVLVFLAPIRRRRRFRRRGAEICDEIVAEVARAGIHDIEDWLRGTRH